MKGDVAFRRRRAFTFASFRYLNCGFMDNVDFTVANIPALFQFLPRLILAVRRSYFSVFQSHLR
jgi:hypothetical protein